MSLALVTGANGFTASYVCRQLLNKGYNVRGLVRDTADMQFIKGLPIELKFADLATNSDFEQIMDNVDIVYHIAAAYRTENVPKKYFWDVNVNGTLKLLEAAKKAGVKKFVHSSTVGVQGEIKNPPANESAPYNPGDYYQESKADGEKAVLDFFQTSKFPITIVRPVGIYGPGDTRFLKLFKHIYNGNFRMIGNGKVLYHMTYVEDLARGFILAGENDESVGEIFTIGGEGFLTLNELVEKIALVLHRKISKIKIPVFPVWTAGLFCEIACKPFNIEPPIFRRRVDFFIKDRAFDISKAKRKLGYSPQVSLEEGLQITVDWYIKNGWL